MAEVEIEPNYNDDLAFLPVAGMTMQVPQGYEQLTWLGNGPEETYIDRWKGTTVGKWESTVTDNFFPYVQTSETGNHVGCNGNNGIFRPALYRRGTEPGCSPL